MDKAKTYIGKIIGVAGFSIFILMLFSYTFSKNVLLDLFGVELSTMFQGNLFTRSLVFITNVMSFWGIMILGVVLGIFLSRRNKKRCWHYLFLYTTAISIGSIFVQLVKFVVQRARPLSSEFSFTGYSFPSGHSFSATVVYGFFLLMAMRHLKTNLQKGIVAFACISLILLTGYSRIYLGAHYLTDVVAGYGFGIFVLAITNHYIKKV